MNAPASQDLRHRTLPLLLLAGDTLCVFAGLLVGYGLRYHTPLGSLFIEVTGARLRDYLPLLFLGTAFLLGAFAHLNLYDERLLLRRYQALNIILKGTAFWLFAYLGVSLVLKFNPPISRLFVVFACGGVLTLLYAWRNLFYAWIASSELRHRIQQRVALLGWTTEAQALVADIQQTAAHPFRLVGMIDLPAGEASRPPFPGGCHGSAVSRNYRRCWSATRSTCSSRSASTCRAPISRGSWSFANAPMSS